MDFEYLIGNISLYCHLIFTYFHICVGNLMTIYRKRISSSQYFPLSICN